MNVASKELCQELFELSGYNPWEAFWMESTDDEYHVYIPDFPKDVKPDAACYPAYELGYLLRKLPKHLEIENVHYELIMRSLSDNDIRFHYWSDVKKHRALSSHMNTGLLGGFGDTPEDAACKLAIELFKQGILK